MKTLIAGFGNIFLSDDGFGCEVIRDLQSHAFPPDVYVRDFGISGMHLALEMSAGYDLVIIVDAVSREDAPGTVFAIEVGAQDDKGVADAHAMDVLGVLALYGTLCEQSGIERHPTIIVAGCVPESVDEGIGLSESVRAALPVCAQLVHKLTREYQATGALS